MRHDDHPTHRPTHHPVRRPEAWWNQAPASGPRPDLKIGDAERTAVTEALQRHYSEGRLDEAELEERLDRALAARTEGDLAEIVQDLPGPRPWRPAEDPRDAFHRHPRHRRGSRLVPAVLLLGASHYLHCNRRTPRNVNVRSQLGASDKYA